MSSSASRQQCADANAVMWTNTAASAVRAVSAQTLVSVGTFTNHAGAVASAATHALQKKKHSLYIFACLHASHTLQSDTAAPTHCCLYPVRRPSTIKTARPVQPSLIKIHVTNCRRPSISSPHRCFSTVLYFRQVHCFTRMMCSLQMQGVSQRLLNHPNASLQSVPSCASHRLFGRARVSRNHGLSGIVFGSGFGKC